MADGITTDVVARISADSSKFVEGMRQASQSAEEMTQKVSNAHSMSMKLGAVSAAIGATLIHFAHNAFTAASRVEELDVAMQAVGKSTGLGYKALEETALAIKKNGIEMQAAQNMTLLYANAQLNLASSIGISRVAQDLAVISGSNSTETATRLTYAIMNQDTQMLRSVGITKSASEAFGEYAKAHHLSANALTERQKKEAITEMIMKEGAKVAGTYEAAMTSASKVLRSFPRLFDDIYTAVGRTLNDAFGPLIVKAYHITKSFVALIEEGGALAPYLDAITMAFQYMMKPITNALSAFDKFLKKIQTTYETGNKYREMLGTTKQRTQELADKTTSLADAITKVMPIFAALGSFFAIKAGTALLSMLPVVGGLLGGLVPFVGVISTLAFLVPEFQQKLMDLGSALAPLIPVVLKIATAVGTFLMSAFQMLMTPLGYVIDLIKNLANWIVQHQELIKNLTVAVVAWYLAVQIASLAQVVWAGVMVAWGAVTTVAGVVMGAFTALVNALRITTLLANAATWIWYGAQVASIAITKAYQTVLVITKSAMAALRSGTLMATAAQWLLNTAIAALSFLPVIIGIGLLIAAFVYAWKHIKGFGQGFKDVFNFIVNHAGHAIQSILKTLADLVRGLGQFLQKFSKTKGIGDALVKGAGQLEHFGDKISEVTSGDAWGKMTGAIDRMMTGAKAKFDELIKKAKDFGKTTKEPDDKGNNGAKNAAAVKARADTAHQAALARLDEWKKQAKDALDYAKNVEKQMSDFGKVSTLNPASDVPVTAEYITANMQERLNKIKSFGEHIKQLVKMKLDRQTLLDIVAMGPMQGDQMATALIAGGQSAINQINSLQKQLGTASADVGTSVGDVYSRQQYGFGIATAAGIASSATTITNTNHITISGAVDKATAEKITKTVTQAVTAALKAAAKKK